MYITTAYLYQQIQKVLMIDTSGNYFDARWSQVYAKKLKLNRGVDNVILFQFQNQDQRPVNINGRTFVFRVISQNGKDLLYSAELVSINDEFGRAKVTVPSVDARKLLPQTASWSIEVISGNLEQAVFVDEDAGARGTIDIVDSVMPEFIASTEVTIPTTDPEDEQQFSSIIDTDGQRAITFQFKLTNFTGNLQAQGSSSETMSETVEWYDVEFEPWVSGNAIQEIALTNYTGTVAANISGYHPMLRLEVNKTTGTINEIVYR